MIDRLVSLNTQMSKDEKIKLIRERIVAFLQFLGASQQDAQDIAQDVLILLEEKYKNIEDVENLVAVAIQTARFKLWDLRRKAETKAARYGTSADTVHVPARTLTPEQILLAQEQTAMLVEAIGHLDEDCRRLVELQRDDRTNDEIMVALGCTAPQLSVRRFRCFARLRKLLGDVAGKRKKK
jgi:RNA polymerase sigma factor (sigma-70 family)